MQIPKKIPEIMRALLLLIASFISIGCSLLEDDKDIECAYLLQPNFGFCSPLSVSPDGKHLATVVSDNILTSSDQGKSWTYRTIPGTRSWRHACSSASGEMIVAEADGSLYLSGDYGATWGRRGMYNTTTDCAIGFSSMLMPHGGDYLLAIDTNGYGNGVYRSSNGIAWDLLLEASANNFFCLAASHDGKTIAVAERIGGIQVSKDSGGSWNVYFDGTRQWYSISCSADGSRIIASASDGLHISTDGGSNWLGQNDASTMAFDQILQSDDGKQAVGVNYGGIYTSSDGGLSWTAIANAAFTHCSALAVSSDCKRIIAGMIDGGLFVSTDGAKTWIDHSPANASWKSISSSDDGSHLVACADLGDIFTSSDGGASWVDHSAPNNPNWSSLAITDDGSVVASVNDGHIYTVSGYGNAWVERDQIRGWMLVVASSNGTSFAAITEDSVFVSTTNGASWSECASIGYQPLQSLAISDDGNRIVVGTNGDRIYTSSDGGENWKSCANTDPSWWVSITASSDCTRIAAVASDSYVYISSDFGATWSRRFVGDEYGYPRWCSVSSSSSGQRLAVGGDFSGVPGLFTSNDYGGSWHKIETPSASSWTFIDVSSDGGSIFSSSGNLFGIFY